MRDSNTIWTPTLGKILANILAEIHKLAFGSICCLFIGQILTHRASSQAGVSLSNLSLRNWISDPPSIITDAEITKNNLSGGLNVLAVFAIIAAITTLLFSTATSALSTQYLLFTGDSIN
jgi:hypothetical protein